jgi:hypothetical protein
MRKLEVMFDAIYTAGIRSRATFTPNFVTKSRNYQYVVSGGFVC